MASLIDELRLASLTGTTCTLSSRHATLLVTLLDELHKEKLGGQVGRLEPAAKLLSEIMKEK